MMGNRPSRGLENSINTVVWIAVGALIGWAAAGMMKEAGRLVMVENMAVAIFGAFLGGEFLSTMLQGATKEAGFTVVGLGLAGGMAVAMLLLLRLMRGSVGPMRPSKPKPRR